jgi:carboxylesterase type B
MATQAAEAVKTEASAASGVFRGELTENCRVFRGIRYAEAERWEFPRLIECYDGVYDATEFGSACYQKRAFEADSVANPFYYREFREGASYTYSEDCLYLNIWTPKEADRLPVVVYIHGGSFNGGCSYEKMIDGSALCARGVILVTLNYRLGPFGFISHPSLRTNNGVCGNYGLFDQLAALKWIRRNIAGFGGDPERVTVMGQSAGAMSVADHCLSEQSRGLFSAAVMMSGAGALSGFAAPLTPEQTRPYWDEVCRLANVPDIEALRRVDPKTLYYAWLNAQKNVRNGMFCTAPVVDGRLIARQPRQVEREGGAADIPYLIGITINDMIPIILRHFAVRWIRSRERAGGKPCYSYLFDRALPGDDKGAWHACDMLYIFGTLATNWRPFTDVDRELSEKMVDMLAAFAKTGDPNCEGLPQWKSGAHRVMRLADTCYMRGWPDFSLIKNTIVKKGPM